MATITKKGNREKVFVRNISKMSGYIIPNGIIGRSGLTFLVLLRRHAGHFLEGGVEDGF